MAKDKKSKAPKKDKQTTNDSIAGIPSAASSVARIKARGSFIGFAFGGIIAHQAHCTWFGVGAWALASGIVCGLLAWWIGLILWEAAIPAESRARQREVYEEMQARLAARKQEAE